MDHGPLIDVARLRETATGSAPAQASAPTLLDVRWSLTGPPGRDDYRQGHISGARFVDLDKQLAAPHVPGTTGRHPMPSAQDFQATMRSLGVSDDRPVVVYDAGNSTSAARAWWLLRYFGHRDVRVLDGGYAAWTAAGLPIQKGDDEGDNRGADNGDDADAASAARTDGDFTAVPGAMPLIDAEGAAKYAVEGILLDARAAARYRGEIEPVDPVAGHIPNAVSAPTTDNVGPDDRFLSPRLLRTRFAALGVNGLAVRPVAAYCGSGVTAAHEVLALEVAGISAALYAGSWSEWITDPSRPVATGG